MMMLLPLEYVCIIKESGIYVCVQVICLLYYVILSYLFTVCSYKTVLVADRF